MTQAWKRLSDEGNLSPPMTHFWETKPPEELYDLELDPDETVNLAELPEHRVALERLREAEQSWVAEIRDLGFLPEPDIYRRSLDSTPYEIGHDPLRYPLDSLVWS